MTEALNHIRLRKFAILAATLATILGGCAMAGCAMAGHPATPVAAEGVAAEPSRAEHGSSTKLGDRDQLTIADWEARIRRHGATLFSQVHGAGGPKPSPADPPSTGPTPTGPQPATRPYRRQTTRRRPATNRANAGTSGGAARQPIRCRGICRTVRAICYAAKRICQIAARIGKESARAACRRNQETCRSARAISTRQGCVSCGHAKQSRKKQTRRACLKEKRICLLFGFRFG